MSTIKGDGARPSGVIGLLAHALKQGLTIFPLPLRRHILYFRYFRKWGNFRNPTEYNEKVQWRIINDRRIVLGLACDKLASKSFARIVAERERLPLRVPETYWVGTDVRELFALRSKLPDRWVLKPNHSSGRFRLIVSKDGEPDWNELVEAGRRWMLPDEETGIRGHYGYTRARRLIFSEERVGEGNEAAMLRVHGVARGVIDIGYSFGAHGISAHRTYAYDSNLRRIPSERATAAPLDEPSAIDTLGTTDRASLLRICSALCAPFDHIRADLYVEGGFWFSEFTAYSASGLGSFGPTRMRRWSDAWQLPDVSINDPNEQLWRSLLSAKERGSLQEHI